MFKYLLLFLHLVDSLFILIIANTPTVEYHWCFTIFKPTTPKKSFILFFFYRIVCGIILILNVLKSVAIEIRFY